METLDRGKPSLGEKAKQKGKDNNFTALAVEAVAAAATVCESEGSHRRPRYPRVRPRNF